MKQTIICPNCLEKFKIETIGRIEYVYLEGFCMDNKQEIYSPREKFRIDTDKIQERVNYLLDNWSNISYVLVTDEKGREINRFVKSLN